MRGRIRYVRRYDAETGYSAERKEFYLDDRQVTEEEYRAALPPPAPARAGVAPGAEATWRRPVVSTGAAVVPKRIKQAEEKCARAGVPTDFTTNRGKPIFTSRAHRKAVLRVFGMHDADGGFGD